jgi:hypothetical protein
MHGVRFNPIHKVINKHKTSSMIEEPMKVKITQIDHEKCKKIDGRVVKLIKG